MKIPIFALFLAGTLWVSAQDPAALPPQFFDFQKITLGVIPDDFMATDQDARFQISAVGDNHHLELMAQPIAEGGMLLGKSIKGICTVVAKIKATGKKRTQPRLGAGVHGISGPRLVLVPATKELQLILTKEKDDGPVTSVPYAWQTGTWTWIELTVKPDGIGSAIEGRAWQDGQVRPEKPTLTYAAKDAPGQGKGSVWGTPYSEFPILFDDITIKSTD